MHVESEDLAGDTVGDDVAGATDGGADAPPAIRLVDVSKTFAGSSAPAVSGLSLEMAKGELTALVGPSGCGKSTTLKMINRLLEPTSGEIYVQGVEIRDQPKHELRRQIGYVIQQIGLFPHRTIAHNIATVPRLLGWPKARIKARTAELAEQVGLAPELLDRYPAALSGGQQQRVGVARALAADPPVLLMDEPYSAVDPIVRKHLQDDLLALQRDLHKTIVLVTHDIDEAIKLGDRIVLLNVGGIVEQQASPAEMLRAPANEFVETFLGRERGLKRMALITVDQVDLTPGPVLQADAPAADAKAVLAESGTEWVGVLDGDQMVGWAWGRDLAECRLVGDAPREPFRAYVRPGTSIREALDNIVNSRTRVAVVLDDEDDRYLGMLTVDELAEALE
jgi:osmoprotectant transport system ATP-binding protein